MTLSQQFPQRWQQVQHALQHHMEAATPLSELTWIVGVSGGPDSLALLDLLCAQGLAQQIVVAHFNHQLRPVADADAAFVQQTAVSRNLPFAQKTVNIAAVAAQTRTSQEAAARTARYAFFAELARQHAPAAVVVAHHADDQAETVLLHLLRGSGLAGLRGMQLVAPLPTAPDIPLIRPLLTIRRADIEAYCEAHELHPLRDLTNEDPTYATRNRIRHDLLPLLADYNPQIVTTLTQLAAITAADYEWLGEAAAAALQDVRRGQGDGWLLLDRVAVAGMSLALQRLLLRQAVLQVRPFLADLTLTHIEVARALLAAEGTASVDLPAGVVVRVSYDALLLYEGDLPTAPLGPQMAISQPQPLPVPGSLRLANGWTLTTELADVDWTAVRHNADRWRAYVPAALAVNLFVRGRQPGEAMQPLGMNGRSASLQDIMVNRQLPHDLRDLWPLVATDHFPVWLVGHVADQRAKVTPAMTTAVVIQCHPPTPTL